MRVRAFLGVISVAGCVGLTFALRDWHSADPLKFVFYVVAALLVSPLKVTLPGVNGTLSVNFLFTLLGILELSLPETLVIALASTIGQLYWKPARQPKPVQLIFNLSQVTLASSAAFLTYTRMLRHVPHTSEPFALLMATTVYFACNSAAMSTIIGLTEGRRISAVWVESYLWSFAYYLVGAAAAALISFLNQKIGWQSSFLVLPPIYLMYRSYRLYLGKLETEARMAEQASNLHLRTVEALALAIEAKDESTGEHLQRVRVYAIELAHELGLSASEKDALKAAAVLHDIGKLAVPEHIISKPGKLTPQEFERIKIHPVIGAEILEQVHFPYPVVPIVRSHHEKWDGSGYPDGLAGEAIPIGARILAAVDCLDALASDRQYRKALPLDQAMAAVSAQAGTSFDPRVVSVLQRRYVELEKMAKEQPAQIPPKLSTDVKVERGYKPAAGFAVAAEDLRESPAPDFLASASQAKKQCDEILHISRTSGCLAVADVGALIALRLKSIIPFDSFALFSAADEILVTEFVMGESSHLLSSLRVPFGEGLTGWVAQNRKLILNGNPSVEPGYDPAGRAALRSALLVPLENYGVVRAVLALYRARQDAFTADELRILQAVRTELTSAIVETDRPKTLQASTSQS